MKVIAVLFVVLAVASAFAPVPAGRASTELKKSFFDNVSEVKIDVLGWIRCNFSRTTV